MKPALVASVKKSRVARLVTTLERHSARGSGVSRAKPLKVAAPIRSLLDATGLTQVELAERDGTKQNTISGAVTRGGGVSVEVLARLCKAAGYELRLSVAPIGSGKEAKA